MQTLQQAHTVSPVGLYTPEGLQDHAHMRSGAELLIEGVTAVCVLNVHIQLHQAAHLQLCTSRSEATSCMRL